MHHHHHQDQGLRLHHPQVLIKCHLHHHVAHYHHLPLLAQHQCNRQVAVQTSLNLRLVVDLILHLPHRLMELAETCLLPHHHLEDQDFLGHLFHKTTGICHHLHQEDLLQDDLFLCPEILIGIYHHPLKTCFPSHLTGCLCLHRQMTS